jgi:exosome complex exonuclease DIS3/RRP44
VLKVSYVVICERNMKINRSTISHVNFCEIILQIIREHYLRTDLWCGSRCCVICPHEKHDLVLSESPQSKSSILSEPHYLLLDTNVILDQIDVFEEDVIKNVIIVQTVIDEVKHRSSAIYKRLRDILVNPGRSFYTFVNEHHR